MIEGVHVNVHMPEIVSLPFGGEHLVDDMFLEKLYQVIQRLQPRYEPLPIVFVGGGAENLAKRFKYPWSEVLLTEYHQYVNAIGACVAPVSGCVDRMFWLDGLTQADALELAKQEAVHLAIQAGAHPQTVMIHNAKMIPLAYVPSKALRVKVKAIGVLSILKGGMQE